MSGMEVTEVVRLLGWCLALGIAVGVWVATRF
jgi:hypothetical protein